MQRFLAVLVLFSVGYFILDESDPAGHILNEPAAADTLLSEAYKNRQNNLQVAGSGKVERVLNDDIDGSRHQRFILRLRSGQTLLIAHNIDVAPRVSGLSEGDLVEFYGEYEWNDRGGVIHWTHHDPNGRHVAGWLKHRGKTYQ